MRATVINVRGRKYAELAADPDFVYVGRACKGFPGSPFGNPFRTAGAYSAAIAVADFGRELRVAIDEPGASRVHPAFARMAKLLPTLRGKRLGCWCTDWGGEGEPAKPCHAVVLARIVNAMESPHE